MVVIQVHTHICYPLSILHVHVPNPKNIERSDKERRHHVVMKRQIKTSSGEDFDQWSEERWSSLPLSSSSYIHLLNLFEEIIRIFHAT